MNTTKTGSMDRIAKQLGLVKPDAKYEEIQLALKNFIPWNKGERMGSLVSFQII
jgi:endonuclease III